MNKHNLNLKIICLLTALLCLFCSCKKSEYILNESTFFLVTTNIQYYPEQYINAHIELDCFIYDLTATDGTVYRLGVRKCSSGYGCNCGKDTIIGFILNYDRPLPDPINQSTDDANKQWIHLSGTISSAQKTQVKIHAYNADGTINEGQTEKVEFLTFDVQTYNTITDYSNLNYYVTK